MSEEAQLARASEFSKDGRYEAAAELLAGLLRLNPDHIKTLYVLADIRVKQGRQAWAASLLRRAKMLEELHANNSNVSDAVDERENSDFSYASDIEAEIMDAVAEFDVWEDDPVELHVVPVSSNATEHNNAISVSGGNHNLTDDFQKIITLKKPTKPEVHHQERRDQDKPAILWKGRHYIEDTTVNVDKVVDLADSASVTSTHDFTESIDIVDESSPNDEDELFTDSMTEEYQSELDAYPAIDEDDWSESNGDYERIEEPDWDELKLEKNDSNKNSPREEFYWEDIDVDFTDIDDIDDEIDQPTESAVQGSLLDLQERIDLWRRTEQIVLNLLRDAGRLDNPARAKHDLQTLSRVLLEGAAGTSRPDISVSVRARQLGRLLARNVSIEDIEAAHACRQSWAINNEFHMDLGGRVRGDGWARKESARHLFSWNLALRMVEVFHATEVDEYTNIFFTLFERWNEKRSLQRQFPIFRLYVYFRLHPAGRELDLFPLGVFDEPDGDEYIERWEDDPVVGVTFRSLLELNGLLPDLHRTVLDLPAIKKNE